MILTLKMLFHKRGTVAAILSLALLVAIQASMASFVNTINSETEVLAGKVNVGGVYLILEENSSTLMGSKIDRSIDRSQFGDLVNMSAITYIMPQRLIAGVLTVKNNSSPVTARAVENIRMFLFFWNARLQGKIAQTNSLEVNVGQVLAKTVSVKVGDELTLLFSGAPLKVIVAGIFETLTQSDSELVIPMNMAERVTGETGLVSFIEFSLRTDGVEEEVLGRLENSLPRNLKIVKTQHLEVFFQGLNRQLSSFLDLWSSIVLLTTVAASYVIALRFTAESTYEFGMLRALGGQRRMLFTLVPTYMVIIASSGAILGLFLGVAGAEAASSVAKLITPSLQIHPFLRIDQVLRIASLTLSSSILGCLHPAFKSAYNIRADDDL